MLVAKAFDALAVRMVNGDGETRSVATLLRVISEVRPWQPDAHVEKDATPRVVSRVVSDTLAGSNRRETLNTPVGVSVRRNTRHPSRV
jgi:hypothetical protein